MLVDLPPPLVLDARMDWKPKLGDAPRGWGLNSLTDSFNSMRTNQYATFDRKDASLDLVAIDRVLFELLEGNVDIRPMFPMNFLLRAHSCFRAACGCAMAGQVYEATVLQRAVLEAAAYGLYIDDDVDRATGWLRREESATSKDRVRKEFGFGSLHRDFKGRHPEMAAFFAMLYKACRFWCPSKRSWLLNKHGHSARRRPKDYRHRLPA